MYKIRMSEKKVVTSHVIIAPEHGHSFKEDS